MTRDTSGGVERRPPAPDGRAGRVPVAEERAPDAAAPGRRVGPFVVVVDGDGVRHAVRLGAVLALSDGDEMRDATVIQFAGGRAVRVPAPLEEVVRWFG
jgi:hypothetical protein